MQLVICILLGAGRRSSTPTDPSIIYANTPSLSDRSDVSLPEEDGHRHFKDLWRASPSDDDVPGLSAPLQPGVPFRDVNPTVQIVADVASTEQEDLLSLLGNETTPDVTFGLPIHERIANNLNFILRSGLKTEDLNRLLSKYPIPENCRAFKSPELNAIVQHSLCDKFVQRDKKLANLQSRIGTAMAASANCLNKLLEIKNIDKGLIESLNDALKILSDVHFNESQVRRSLIRSNINDSLRLTLDNNGIDDFLFGSDLEEKVKATKHLEKASRDLSLTKPKPSNTKSKNGQNPLAFNRFRYRGRGASRPQNASGTKRLMANRVPYGKKPFQFRP
ncbi:hypothetical protein PPYR_15643 [Photinus pyralis]|uniref:Uncharacterized protein n=1 Tax=Photinus pyralis TaxID=7054 RepID=A0A5N3ZYA7_PHOPY|nr:hypothetical protein PPYR_15643 [Photinus pyralis]